jgi:hypothetical protein
MRSLTDEDLTLQVTFITTKNVTEKWGGGKIYY